MNLKPLDFIFETPLYKRIELSGSDYSTYVNMFRLSLTKVDGYCVKCKKESIFSSSKCSNSKTTLDSLIGIYCITLTCGRVSEHKIMIFSNLTEDLTAPGNRNYHIEKVGQIPSHADISIGDLKQFSGELDQNDRSELVRAIGIAAHGVNIGAFVYLRRVFERLLLRTAVQSTKSIDLENFKLLKVSERIEALKDQLPPFLLNNKKIYSILSKGIHELSEEECGNYYSIMHQSVILILHQEQQVKRKLNTEIELSNIIAKFDPSKIDLSAS